MRSEEKKYAVCCGVCNMEKKYISCSKLTDTY